MDKPEDKTKIRMHNPAKILDKIMDKRLTLSPFVNHALGKVTRIVERVA